MARISSQNSLHELPTEVLPEGWHEDVGLQNPGLPDQIVVDNSVEVAVVHNIVHMAVLVIVLPPCLDGQEVPIGLMVTKTTLGSVVLWWCSQETGILRKQPKNPRGHSWWLLPWRVPSGKRATKDKNGLQKSWFIFTKAIILNFGYWFQKEIRFFP